MKSITRRDLLQLGSAAAIYAATGTATGGTPAQAAPMPGAGSEIYWMTALEMSAAIRTKRVSCREVMEAHLSQIALTNPKVNAIVTCSFPKRFCWHKLTMPTATSRLETYAGHYTECRSASLRQCVV